jgi:phosphomannomutase
MHVMEWDALQNGSDIRGVAMPAQGVSAAEVNLTPEVMRRLGLAFVHWLARSLDREPAALTVSAGRDSRISGPPLMTAP